MNRQSLRTCTLVGRAVGALGIAGSLLAASAEGAEGHLDPTFGSGGRVSIDPSRVSFGLYDDPNSVIQQMDGMIVIAGQSTGRLLLARLDRDGSLDVSFSDDGIVTGGNGRSANIVIQQRDGKLVAAGGGSFSGPLVLWRFNSNGRLDGGFGDRGSVILHAVGSARGLVQQADDKLVVVGGSRFARFHPDGSLDATFGENGIVIVRFPSPTLANVLLQQADGKLVVIGSQNLSDFGSPDSGVALARVTADGDFDQAFGEGGIVEIPLRSLMTEGSAQYTDDLSAALQDDGKIVIAGTAAVGARLRGFILRLQANGDPDLTFGSEGIVFVSPAGQRGVTIAADGKITTAATVCSGSDYLVCDMALMQRNADGSVDASFGTPIADFGLEREIRFSQSRAMTRQADGNLVVVGRSRASADDSSSLAIARFSSDAPGFAGLIGLTSTTCQCPDNGGPAEFVVRRTGGSTGAVAVDVATVDGSAVAGSDYVALRRRLAWPDGDQSTRKIVLELIDNSKSAPEAFTLRLSNPTGGAILTTSIATVSITDSAPPVIQLLGDQIYSIAVGEAYVEFGATATDDVDGDISGAIVIDSSAVNTSVAGSYTVTYDVNDSSGNAAETATRTVHVDNSPGELQFAGGSTLEVLEGGPFGEPAVRYGVVVLRGNGSQGRVSVIYSTEAGTAESGKDFTPERSTLSWNDGDTTERHVFVTILDDELREGSEELRIKLSDPTGGATLAPLRSAKVVVIADDDAPGGGGGGTLELERGTSTVGEADGSVVLTVRRIGASSGAVSVDYETSSGTAIAGTDFAGKSGTLSWAAGDATSKTIGVNVTSDTADESDEMFTVTLSSPSGGATLGSISTATVTIVDDDDSMPNSVPVISGTPADTVVAGSAYEFQPTASDADGDALTFNIQNRPVWASFNSQTGRLSGTPTDAMAGSYGNIVLSVSDGVASVSLAPFSIAVSSPGGSPMPEPTPTRSGGGQFGFLSLLLLGTARLLRKPPRPPRARRCSANNLSTSPLSVQPLPARRSTKTAAGQSAYVPPLLGGLARGRRGAHPARSPLPHCGRGGTATRSSRRALDVHEVPAPGSRHELRTNRPEDCRAMVAAVQACAIGVLAIGGCLLAAPVDAREGDLDPAFADVGRLGPITDLEGPVWSLEALDDDGMLLAGGEFELDCPDPYCDAPPIRFRGTNFLKQVSGAGVIESSLDAALPENFQVRDVARQPDGKLVVVGRTAETDSPSLIYLKSRLTILRLRADGQLDTTFGHNGLVELPIEVNDSNSQQGGMSVLLEPDGRIVVSGSLNQQLIVLRLLENGSFDDSFGEFGAYRESQRNIDAGLQILPASGGSYRVLGDRCEVVGLTGAGALDATFGTSGVAMATAQGGPGSCSSIAGLSDDRLLVAGSAGGHGFVTRLLAAGQLDPGFSAGGIVDSDYATALAVGEGESIYVAVTEVDGASIMRLQASGERDRQFGSAGRTLIDLPSDFGVTSRVHTMVVRPDGSVLAAGVASSRWWLPRIPFAIRLLGRGAAESPGVLGFSEQDTVDTSEGEAEVIVHVRRTGGDSGSVGVAFQTSTYGTPEYAAVPGQDFDEVSDRLTWDDGDTTSREIRVPIRTDGVAEGHEIFQVRLSDVTGGAGLGTRNVAVHIDSDGAPFGRFYFSFTESTVIEGDSVQLTVYRDDYVNGEVSVTLTPIAGTATAAEDFDADPIRLFWDDGNHGARTVAIAIVDDSVQEGTESFTVELSNPTGGAVIGEPSRMTVMIEASDQEPPPPGDAGRLGFPDAGTLHPVAEGSGAIHLPVFRSNGSTGQVSMVYETIAETATPGLDFTAKSDTVTWGDGETGIKFIDVDISDDDLAESDETFRIRLSNPTGGATINGSEVQVEIRDDDSADDDEPEVALLSTESTVDEADGSVVLTVARSRSAVGAISVDYATSNDTAMEGSDFVAAAGTLHWTDGDSASKVIHIDVINDAADESDESFRLTLFNPWGATLGSNSITIVTITDDDAPSDDDPPNDEGGGGGGSDGLFLLGLLLTGLARSRIQSARPPPMH